MIYDLQQYSSLILNHMDVIPINIKNQMALRNCAYLSTSNAKDPNSIVHLKIKNKYLKCMFSPIIEKQKIGMSKSLRQYLGVDLIQPVKVQPTQPLPVDKYGITHLTLQLSIRKNPENLTDYSDKNLIAVLRANQTNIVFNLKQSFFIEAFNVIFEAVVTKIVIGGKQKQYGVLVQNTIVDVVPAQGQNFSKKSSQQKSNKNSTASSEQQGSSLFKPDFTPEKMGIGGLDNQLFNIFRRTFASRRFTNEVVEKFGVKHVKGILLYGPPGTGKTLIARQLAKTLNIKAQNLKIVNGPQVFSKYVGESEQNIRKLFIQARQDQKKYGPKSPLHIIVFDQIDAICKQRGLYSGGTNVNDQVVNQLLSNIDGVEALNNIIVIGMTNRKDLLDEAILRPGRFQVHIEVTLPNEKGRQQILNIHTSRLRQNKLLHENCDLLEIAKLTKNYTGAQIESLIKSAASYAITRATNVMEFSEKLKINESKLKVQKQDFLKALQEIKPQFGIDQDKFNVYFRDKNVNYGGSFDQVSNAIAQSTQIADGGYAQVRSVLLYGPPGTGKTTFAVNFAKHCTFPYIKIISPEAFVSQSESSKVHAISKIFEDAYKTSKACIVIDNIERLIQYTAVGRRFSNSILQTILVMISKIPPHSETKLLILGTTSRYKHMDLLDIPSSFTNKIHVPALQENEISTFVSEKYGLDQRTSSVIGKNMKGASIRNLIQVAGLVDSISDPHEWLQHFKMLFDMTTDQQ